MKFVECKLIDHDGFINLEYVAKVELKVDGKIETAICSSSANVYLGTVIGSPGNFEELLHSIKNSRAY